MPVLGDVDQPCILMHDRSVSPPERAWRAGRVGLKEAGGLGSGQGIRAFSGAGLTWLGMILGTLFERGLDPAMRAQFGAHYTDRDKIPAEFLTHVSPLGWEHINLTGEIPLARHGTDGQRETPTRRMFAPPQATVSLSGC